MTGAALVLIAGAVAAIILFTGGTSSPSFSQQVSPVLLPVASTDRALGSKLDQLRTPRQLAGVAAAATTARQAILKAQGALSVLKVASENAQAKRLLVQALAANLSYTDTVTAAAAKLTGANLSAARLAQQQVTQSYRVLAAAAPELNVPASATFASANQLQTLATAQAASAAAKAAAARAKAASTAALRTYARSIDSLLQNSADTRSNLATLITDIQNGQMGASEAQAAIASIVTQRQDLQNQISAIATPPPFQTAAVKLRASISAALQDDYAIQRWMNAWYDNNPAAFDRAYAQHVQATAQATAAKDAFLRLYNKRRTRLLHLQPINVSY